MLIKFTEARVLMVPHTEGAAQLRIIPGVNEVDDRIWAVVRPSLEPKIKRGSIVEIAASEKGTGKEKTLVGKAITELPPQEAESIIKQTLDVVLLESWKKLEKRDEVRLAIATQIDEMKKRDDKKKDSE